MRSQQDIQLEELATLALRRSEAAIDYGAEVLAELHDRHGQACDPATLQAVRLEVYRGGAIKDIRMLSPAGSVICSAFSETLEFDVGAVDRSDMTPSGDGTILLYPKELFFGHSLGMRREFGGEGGIDVILGVGGSALDVLPVPLRDHGDVLLRMRDGSRIASANESQREHAAWGVREIALASERYPVDAVVRVEKAALSSWNDELYLPFVACAALIGAVFGGLLMRPAFRPETPLSQIDRALAAEEFEPFFQPVFDIRAGTIAGAEVLVRWIRPDGSVLSPARFIDLAEQSGRVRPMTWQIMEKALLRAAPVLAERPDFYLSFNVVPDHFVSAGFAERLGAVVRAAGAKPHNIGIEITERQGFEDADRAREAVAVLRRQGYRVLIDDVGIGHSGLSQIQMLGADTIKIDKFFVDSISLDTSSNIVVEMLVRLARDKKMTIVAEGIETEAQAAALAACGVGYGQGYLAARPAGWDEFSRAMADGTLAGRLRAIARRVDKAA